MRQSGETFQTRRLGKSLFAEIRAGAWRAQPLDHEGPVFLPRVLDYDRARGKWVVEEFVKGVASTREDMPALVRCHRHRSSLRAHVAP